MEKARIDRFIAKEGEFTATIPQCKKCLNSVIDSGLKCKVLGKIDIKIRLNKEKCINFTKK